MGDEIEDAFLLGKSPGVISGKIFAAEVYALFPDIQVEWYVKDGDEITAQDAKNKKPIAKLRGKASSLLLAERTALNILSRASGVATQARKYVNIAKSNNWKGEIAATRKTTPGFSLVEKYSVLVGGASTHRLDLSQMIMLKDNHVWSVGNITQAVKKARSLGGFSTKIEVG